MHPELSLLSGVKMSAELIRLMGRVGRLGDPIAIGWEIEILGDPVVPMVPVDIGIRIGWEIID